MISRFSKVSSFDYYLARMLYETHQDYLKHEIEQGMPLALGLETYSMLVNRGINNDKIMTSFDK